MCAPTEGFSSLRRANPCMRYCPNVKFQPVPFDNTPENAREIMLCLRRSWPAPATGRALATIIASALMPSLDTTIISIGITSLMEAFGVSEAAVQRVSTAYLLALAGRGHPRHRLG